jgi:hypothetical protein
LVGWHYQLYSGIGADIVMESIALIDVCGFWSVTVGLRQLRQSSIQRQSRDAKALKAAI